MAAIALRFRVWLGVLIALVLVFSLAVVPGLRVETDLLDLLPRDAAEGELSDRVQQFAAANSRKVLFLVGESGAQAAEEATTAFAAELERSGAFTDVRVQWGEQAEVLASLYREYRFVLLPPSARTLLEAGNAAELERSALASLYSPLAFARPTTHFDPLGLEAAYLFEQMPVSGSAQLEGDRLVVRQGESAFVLVLADTAGSVFGVAVQEKARAAIERAQVRAGEVAGAPVEVLVSGALPFAAAATSAARREVALFSTLGTMAVLGLMLSLFRSWRAPALGLLALGSGACAGIAATHFVFGQLHLIALVFGSSLIGVAIDYSMHYLSDQFRDEGWTPAGALDHVARPILMGMAATLIGFAGLLLLPFPGLTQMAVIALAGLPIACGTVLCLYPALVSRTPARLPQWCARALARLDARVARPSRRGRILALIALTVLVAGLARLEFQDDVRTLQPRLHGPAAMEQRVRNLLPDSTETALFLVTATDPQALLEREERLTRALDALVSGGALASYRAVSQSLPSHARQRRNHDLLHCCVYAEQGVLPAFMRQLGYAQPAIDAELARFPREPRLLDPQQWLEHPGSASWRSLWLGERTGTYASIVSLGGARDLAALRESANAVEGARFVDRVQDISHTLAQYRRAVVVLLAGAYVALAIVLALAFGPRASLLLLLPPVGASALALGALGWLGIPLTLFTALSLLLLLAMGVDYAIFLREAADQRRTALLAVTLSALTTLVSFGLLAFSSTPFISAIGITLALGIGGCWFLAVATAGPAPTAVSVSK